MINQIGGNQQPVLAKPTSYNKDAANEQKDQDEQAVVKPKADAVEIRQKKEVPVTYSNITAKKQASPSDKQSLKSMAEQANENLGRIVEELILKQGKVNNILHIKGFSNEGEVTAKDIEEAQLAISEDGEFGVKAVSDRLVEFAKAVSGGDKTKYEELRGAIERGFEAAREAFGGQLPEISNENYNETMRKLAEWANE